MKTFKSICIGCGKEVEFEYFELGDIIDTDYEITEEAEVGWCDFVCPECDWCVDYNLIEMVVNGDLEGFSCCAETASEVRNLIKAVMKRCPAVIAEIRSELDEGDYTKRRDLR